MKTKRKAETLAESVISMAVFGVLMSGVCSFMSNQTQFIAWTRHRDELMYKAQLLDAKNIYSELGDSDVISDDFDWDKDKRILTVKISNDSMEFFFPKN